MGGRGVNLNLAKYTAFFLTLPLWKVNNIANALISNFQDVEYLVMFKLFLNDKGPISNWPFKTQTFHLTSPLLASYLVIGLKIVNLNIIC